MKPRIHHSVLICSLLAACPSKNAETPIAKPAPPPAMTAERLDDITALATGAALPADERAAILAKLAAGTLTLDAYLDSLVATPAFSREIVPHVLLGYLDVPPYAFQLAPLDSKEIDGVTIRFLQEPCSAKEAVDVNPWWDLKAVVKICPDDYRPTVFQDKKGNSCSGGIGSSSGDCGCGPNLINCTDGSEQSDAIVRSLVAETRRSIGYIVEHDRPLGEVFTSNSSFRDRNAAFVYARDKMYQGAPASVLDLGSWPEDGQWAPRAETWPGSQSGILTNRQLLWMGDAPRDRILFYQERAWCKSSASFGVDTDSFDSLVHKGLSNLRLNNEGWKDLAAMPGCTKCHARIDYGAQAFTAFMSAYDAEVEMPTLSRHGQHGEMYSDDIEDRRGTIELSPHSFGEFLVAQSEFPDCMVQRVEQHVLGTADPIEHAELVARFRETGTMRPLFETALRLYARRPPSPAPTQTIATMDHPRIPASGPRSDRAFTLSNRLVTLVTDNCQECHMDARTPNGFLAEIETTKHLDRDHLIAMGNLVAFGLMPKPPAPLLASERRALLQEIIAAVAPDAIWASNASAYWLGDGFQPSRSLFVGAVRERVAREAGSTAPPAQYVFEETLEGDQLTLTTSLLMEASQLAVTSCKGKQGPQLTECLTRATRPEALLADH